MNTTKDPVVYVKFGGDNRPLRWDFNTVAELQDLGFDLTPGSPDVARLETGPKIPLRLMLAMATAALNSGADDGRAYTTKEVGRIMTAEGEDCKLLQSVLEVRKLAEPDEEKLPLAESAASNA